MTLAPRAVLDANVCISGLINPSGPPGKCLDLVRRRAVIPVASRELLHEIRDVLRRPKLAKYALQPGDFDDLAAAFVEVPRSKWHGPALNDPRDEHVVAAAITGRVDAVVTGDSRDLLVDDRLTDYLDAHGIALLTARQFVEVICLSD